MEFIDGHPVIAHRVRFRGRAEIDDSAAACVTDGRLVVWLVVSRSCPPSFHPTKKEGEERYRFAIQDVEKAVPIPEGPVRESAIHFMTSGNDQGYLAFETAPRQTEFGFFDPLAPDWNEGSPITAERETGRLARHLYENWGLTPDVNDTAVDITIKILAELRARLDLDQADPEPPAPLEPPTDEPDLIEDELVDAALSYLSDHHRDDDLLVADPNVNVTERLGSVYGDRHEGRHRAVIDHAFGDQP